MLENLLNTKLKKTILSILFRYPVRSFSIQEIAHLTGGNKVKARDSLREFWEMGVVSAAAKQKRRYFRINPHFRLFDELRDLVVEEDLEIDDEVIGKIRKLPNLRFAVLSGVFTLEPQLSVDLLLVGKDINKLRMQKLLSEIEKIIGEEINYCILNEDEYEYRQNMSDRFIRDLLDHPHIIIKRK